MWLKLGKRTERAFKSSLRNSGYSEKTADEIWKWYTYPPKKQTVKIPKALSE